MRAVGMRVAEPRKPRRCPEAESRAHSRTRVRCVAWERRGSQHAGETGAGTRTVPTTTRRRPAPRQGQPRVRCGAVVAGAGGGARDRCGHAEGYRRRRAVPRGVGPSAGYLARPRGLERSCVVVWEPDAKAKQAPGRTGRPLRPAGRSAARVALTRRAAQPMPGARPLRCASAVHHRSPERAARGCLHPSIHLSHHPAAFAPARRIVEQSAPSGKTPHTCGSARHRAGVRRTVRTPLVTPLRGGAHPRRGWSASSVPAGGPYDAAPGGGPFSPMTR